MKKIVCLGTMLLSTSVFADYHIATFNNSYIDSNKPSRVIVIGTGDDLGLQFHEVAKAKALRYVQEFSNDQIVVIAIKEKHHNSRWSLERLKFKIVREEKEKFNAKVFLSELSRLSKIKSLDIFSHSTDQFGLHLNMRAYALSVRTEGLSSVANNFTKDAYVFLHGCNNGQSLAPHLSRVWNIPVAGSLTSSNFQRLNMDGEFYLEDENKHPNKNWEKVNNVSFDNAINCSEGACVRMKPENHAYNGYWGSYRDGGLPFYKFFCANNSIEDCKKAMAKSMLSHTLKLNLKNTSTFSDYKEAVKDYLCPTNSKGTLNKQCADELENSLLTGDMTYNAFAQKMVQCNEAGCKLQITCKGTILKNVPKPGSCKLENLHSGEANTLVREFKLYLDAYKYLK